MNLENLNSLEDKLKKPGYLLFLVVVLLFLIIGFVNLIDHTSASQGVFGLYSLPFFGVMVVYAIATLGWASLLRRPNNDEWLKKAVRYVEQRPLILLAFFAGAALLIWSLFNIDRWIFFPALQVTTLVLIAFATGALLFYERDSSNTPQLWRRIVVTLLVLSVIAELVFQLLTVIGALPSLTVTTNSFAPYSRIYQSDEGFVNRMANQNGWNYPEFQLSPDAKRVVLVGDGSVQAIQVEPEQNMGMVLQEIMLTGESSDPDVEVLSLGYPDYGPGLYLDPALFDFAIEAYQPDEIIAFFDLRNDFQIETKPNEEDLFFILDDQGKVVIHPENKDERHTYQHQVLHVYEGFQPNRFIQSHYLTPRLVANLFNPSSAQAATESELGLANSFVFNAETNDKAMMIATGLIKNAAVHLDAQEIPFRLVTIPAFSEGFYAQPDGTPWQTQFGDADLLLPEREIRAAAAEAGIPFLALGSYFEASGFSPSEIQALYFYDGRGHLTPKGHEVVGTAVYDCFFAQTLSPDAGCDTR